MSLNRYAAKRDAVEASIIEVLEKRGYAVFQISGRGIPDLLVSKLGKIWLVEAKRPKGKLTTDQIAFRDKWTGEAIRILRSVEDALTFPKGELG